MIHSRLVSFLLSLSFLLCTSCSRSEPPKEVALDQVPASLNQAFQKAPAPTKTLVAETIKALNEKAYPQAFVKLQEISARTDLSAPQRQAAAAALTSVNVQMQSAATSGDDTATATRQIYQSTK